MGSGEPTHPKTLVVREHCPGEGAPRERAGGEVRRVRRAVTQALGAALGAGPRRPLRSRRRGTPQRSPGAPRGTRRRQRQWQRSARVGAGGDPRAPNPERPSWNHGWVPAAQDPGPLPTERELTLQLIGPRRAGACVPGSGCGRQKGRKSAFCSEGGATARGPSLPYLCACLRPSASSEDFRESVRAAIPTCEDTRLDVRTTCLFIKLQTFLFLNPKNIGGFCPLLEEGAQGS